MTDPKDRLDNQDHLAVAHDIRQMLTVITGRTGLLLERDPDPELKRHLMAMELAATDAAAMLDRLSGSAGDDFPESCGLARAVSDSGALVLPPDGRWTLDGDVPEDLRVQAPAQIVREVVNNLLTNAVAAMPGGGVITATGTRRRDKVQLVVRDSGPGVDPEVADRIFEIGVSNSGQQGRGLGLAGCRALLVEYQGTLVLAPPSDPDAGQGACFVIELPAADPAADSSADSSSDHSATLEPGEILVVDDEPAVQDMLSDLLAELGWQPVVTRDADTARSAFSPGRYGVALVDQSLPGMSGLELAKQLREQDPEIVLVLVTGWGNEDIIAKAGDHGFDLTEKKPLTVGKIRHILQRAAGVRRVRREEREEP